MAVENVTFPSRDEIVQELFDDFLDAVRKPGAAPADWEPEPKRSIIGRYYDDLIKRGFRARVRERWRDRNRDDNLGLIRYLAGRLYREYRFSTVINDRWELVEPLLHVRAGGRDANAIGAMRKRERSRATREELRRLSEANADKDELNLGDITDGQLRALIDAMLDLKSDESSVRVMETLHVYRLEQELQLDGKPAESDGGPVLGGDTECRRIRKDLEHAFGGDSGTWPKKTASTDLDFDNRIDEAIRKEMINKARQWFSNCGCNLSAEDDGDRYNGSIRVVDIPVKLVKLWFDNQSGNPNPSPNPDAGSSGAIADAYRLYRAFAKSARNAPVNIPLDRRLMGDGSLYLLSRDQLYAMVIRRNEIGRRMVESSIAAVAKRVDEYRRAMRLAYRRVRSCVVLYGIGDAMAYLDDWTSLLRNLTRQRYVLAIVWEPDPWAKSIPAKDELEQCGRYMSHHMLRQMNEKWDLLQKMKEALETGNNDAFGRYVKSLTREDRRLDWVSIMACHRLIEVYLRTPKDENDMGEIIRSYRNRPPVRGVVNGYRKINGEPPEGRPERYQWFFEEAEWD